MTELPALVKAAAAACAFLTISYAVSVYAGPDTGPEDLGRGPGAPAGVYRRDQSPAPRRPARVGEAVVAAATVRSGVPKAVTAPPATLVSARTGVAEAAPAGSVAAAASAPPAGAGITDPVPPAEPTKPVKPPRTRPGSGNAGGGSGSGADSSSSATGGNTDRHPHGRTQRSHGSGGCDQGSSRPSKGRAATQPQTPPAPHPAPPSRHVRR